MIDINKSSARSYFFAFSLLITLAMPMGIGGYTLSYIYSIFIVFIITLFFIVNNHIVISLKRLSIVVSFVVLVLVCAFFSSSEIYSFWEYREYARIPIMIVSFYYISNNVNCTVKSTSFLLSMLVLLDFMIFYLWPSGALSKQLMLLVAMPGMNDYLDSYWRHIGIGGNPNVSSLIYAINILIAINILKYNQYYGVNHTFKWFLILSVSISIFLCLMTFSRTGIISCLLAIYLTINNKIKWSSLLLAVLILSYLSFPELWQPILERFTSFSSLEARTQHWSLLTQNFSIFRLMFGSPFEVDVIDNDYLYLLFRFGLVFLLITVGLLFYIWGRIGCEVRRELYFSLILFVLISAIPGGPLTSPKIYTFIVLFGSLIAYKKLNKL